MGGDAGRGRPNGSRRDIGLHVHPLKQRKGGRARPRLGSLKSWWSAQSMVKDADVVGLTEEQARRFEEIDDEVSQTREGIAVWHRLLDRRRLDRKLGLHPIAEVAVDHRPRGHEQGRLRKKADAASQTTAARGPHYSRLGRDA